MDRIVFLGAALCLCSYKIQGLQHVFVLHGNDLHLDTEKPVKLDEETDLFWKFNSSINIAKCVFNNDPVVFKEYAGRAELFRPNCSLKLKKVQHSDSGYYKAVVFGGREQTVAEYKVIVQDPVTPADLTVDPVSNSSDSCNLTVTCSTVDFNISSSFRCDGKNCSHAGEKDLKATKVFSSLIVYLQQDTIYCNHSNQVSWNQTMKALKSYCETETVSSRAIKIAAPIVVLIFLILFITPCVIMKCKSKGGNQENTIYAVPERLWMRLAFITGCRIILRHWKSSSPCSLREWTQQMSKMASYERVMYRIKGREDIFEQDVIPGQTQSQIPSGHESCNSPTSTYALVDFHTGQKPCKTENIPQPETVYAQVDRAAKPNSTVQQQTPRPEEN